MEYIALAFLTRTMLDFFSRFFRRGWVEAEEKVADAKRFRERLAE